MATFIRINEINIDLKENTYIKQTPVEKRN